MIAPIDSRARWQRSARSLIDRSVKRALLYPVFEFRALALTSASSTDHLDPFERAVFDTSRAGVIAIDEQSDILGLHKDFVAHLHDRLRAAELLDHDGRPRMAGPGPVDKSHVAVHLYWDPLAQVLWPRYVPSLEIRSVTLQSQAGRHSVAAGTDGDPYDIALFVVDAQVVDPPATPTVDEAISAIRVWSRELRSHKGIDRRDTLDDPAITVFEGAERVYLCAPTMRGAGGSFEVQDPFGGSPWRPFIRRLSERASEDRGLAKWLDLDPDAGSVVQLPEPPTSDREVIAHLFDEVRQVRLRVEGRGRAGARAQLGFDMIDLAHRLLDRLFDSAPRSEDFSGTDADLYRRPAAGMFGFALPDAALAQAGDWAEPVSLYERCAALLARYESEAPGPLHDVAQRCPSLLINALHVSSGNQNNQMLLLLAIAEGLAAGLGSLDSGSAIAAHKEGLRNGEGQAAADTSITTDPGPAESDATATIT